MAASPNVSMRDLQEWMGHRDYRTTLIYADYEPREGESSLVDEASPEQLIRWFLSQH